jgi:hypothetical protein
MDATYQTLAAADELGEFTVALLAARAGVKATTVRTVLNRNRHLFEQRTAESGRHGGQPHVWKVKEDAKEKLKTAVSEIANRFGPDQRNLLSAERRALPASLVGRGGVAGPNPELATAEDLIGFAPRLPAREFLPHLLRRLLAATPGIRAVSVRAGDGIDIPGIDGRAESTLTSPYVPSGSSAWEFGTGEDPQDKAQKDYRKRMDEPVDVDRAATTFVAVTMRRFRNKDTWAAERRAEGVWRDVWARDADDLYAWLEETPQVHIWASEQLNLYPLEVTTLERWWQAWATQTEPEIPRKLLLAGRRSAARELRQMLIRDPQVIGVYAASRDEATAFTAAALLLDDSDDNYRSEDESVSVALVVSTPREWARLANVTAPIVLIPEFEGADVATALRNRHPVVVPMGPSDDRSRAAIDLPPLGRDEAREIFRSTRPETDTEDADRMAAHARRSLASFRRSRAVNPAYRSPAWAKRPAADVLGPLILVGAWEAEAPSDQAVVSAITGRPYADIERELLHSIDPEDPPFIQAGGRWQLTSPADAWTLLRSLVTQDDLRRWRNEVLSVLTEEDPLLDLPAEERFLAPLQGIRRDYSSALRNGLARSLALMGSNDSGSAPDQRPWAHHAASLVAEVLGNPPDPHRWAALEEQLPALAEAAPDIFLQSAVSGLKGPDPKLKGIFRDRNNQIWDTRSPHTSVLWGLELLSWHPDYVANACDVLASLAEIDPGGRMANRPARSLRSILLPWRPQTAAPLEARIEIVKGLMHRRRDVGWPLLLGLLPRHFDISEPNQRPLFRDWPSVAKQTALSEQIQATHSLIEVALEFLASSPDRWVDLLPLLPHLPADDLDRSLGALATVDLTGLSAGGRLEVWRALVTLINKHRRHPTAQWALPDWVLRRFEEVAPHWEPLDSPERHARLFDWHPDLGVDSLDYNAYDKHLAEARTQVVTGILATVGIDGLDRLITEAPQPGLVGATLADVAGDEIVDKMIPAFDFNGPQRIAARGWLIRMAELYGSDWVNQTRQRASDIPERNRAEFYLALPNEPTTWDAVDADIPDVAAEYWRRIQPALPVSTSEYTADLADRLMQHKRSWAALDLMARQIHRPNVDLSIDLIDRALRAAALEEPLMTGATDYHLGVLLDQLELRGALRATVIELEYLYFGLLQHSRPPRALFTALAEDPILFVHLVCDAFRSASQVAAGGANLSEPDKADIAKARIAIMLLRSWRQPPGFKEDGTVDGAALRLWVEAAREELRVVDRLGLGDLCIGETLSGAPKGVDDVWPCEPVRDLLEEIASPEISQGLAIGGFNARGGTSRGVFDGGRQEDALAQQYENWSKQVMARWPETGRILREMALSYRSMARQQDTMSEKWANSL